MDASGYAAIGQIILGFAQAGTAPDRPDIEPYNPTPIKDRNLKDYLPEADTLMGMQAEMAMSFMKGELPDSVKEQIEAFAGERANRFGYGKSAGRTGNMVARDLGLSALDLMETGQQYSGFLINQARGRMSDDISIDITNANMAYDSWASKAQVQMDNWRGDAERHAGYFNTASSALGTYVQGKENEKSEDRYYELMSRAIGGGSGKKSPTVNPSYRNPDYAATS